MSNNECFIARIRFYFEHERNILIVMLCTIRLMSFNCGNELLVYLPINNNNNNMSLYIYHSIFLEVVTLKSYWLECMLFKREIYDFAYMTKSFQFCFWIYIYIYIFFFRMQLFRVICIDFVYDLFTSLK